MSTARSAICILTLILIRRPTVYPDGLELHCDTFCYSIPIWSHSNATFAPTQTANVSNAANIAEVACARDTIVFPSMDEVLGGGPTPIVVYADSQVAR